MPHQMIAFNEVGRNNGVLFAYVGLLDTFQ